MPAVADFARTDAIFRQARVHADFHGSIAPCARQEQIDRAPQCQASGVRGAKEHLRRRRHARDRTSGKLPHLMIGLHLGQQPLAATRKPCPSVVLASAGSTAKRTAGIAKHDDKLGQHARDDPAAIRRIDGH